MIIRRIDPVSLGKIQAMIGAVMGLLIAFVWAAVLTLGGMAMQNNPGLPGGRAGGGGGGIALMGGLGLVAIIVMPVIYGVMGFLGGLIGALIFNAAAAMTGGLEVDVELEGEAFDQEAS